MNFIQQFHRNNCKNIHKKNSSQSAQFFYSKLFGLLQYKFEPYIWKFSASSWVLNPKFEFSFWPQIASLSVLYLITEGGEMGVSGAIKNRDVLIDYTTCQA